MTTNDSPYGPGSHAPLADGSQPEGYPIKGNTNSMIYHKLDSRSYGRTTPGVWFATPAAAEAAGFTEAADEDNEPYGPGSYIPLADGSQPEGYPIKGNTNSMVYHHPDSRTYGNFVAEVWFASAAAAEAAGFHEAQDESEAAGAAMAGAAVGAGAATAAAGGGGGAPPGGDPTDTSGGWMRFLPWILLGILGVVIIGALIYNQDDDEGDAATATTIAVDETTTTTAAPATTTTVAETTTTGAEETTTTEPVEVIGRGDGVLTLARVLPETGFLDYLGGPMIAGVGLAVEDINAAGGVLGADVVLLEFDSGTDPAVAVPNVNSGLAQGADVIIGAAASGITQAFLDTLNQNGVPNCSPSATSPSFLDQANASIMYRTVPPDEFVAPIIADEIVNDGNGDNVVIVARSDDYGSALAGLVGENLEALNATVAATIQYTDETTFASEADDIVGANPSAVVIISFREAATLLGLLVDQGLDPATFYGADGVFSGQLPALVGGDASVIDGMKVIGASGSDEFNNRLADEGVTDFIYGGQGYDCAIITALWAASEGTDDTTTWDPQTLLDLTQDGTVCTAFADCIVLVEAGEDVDYDGQSGPLSLAPGNPGGDGNLGNPTVTVYSVARYEDGGVLTPFSDTVVDLG